MQKILIMAALTLFSGAVNAGEKLHLMKVHGAVCASCAYGLEKRFKKFDGIKSFGIDFSAGIVSVCTDSNVSFEKEQLTKIFVESGYTFKGLEIKNSCDKQAKILSKKPSKNSSLKPGQNVTVTGIYNGMCDDGEDFYFVYKSDVLEVILPKKGMPQKLTIGTPLDVSGTVVTHGNEIKIKASSVNLK